MSLTWSLTNALTFCSKKLSTNSSPRTRQAKLKKSRCSTQCLSEKEQRKPLQKKKQNAETEAVKPVWNDKHKSIISAVESGKSVFITGSAGTGKTLLLKHLIQLLRKRHKPSEVFVTALTGVAACALKGRTLHSFAGIVRPMASRDGLVGQVTSNKNACERWTGVKALVIDEISMVEGELFDTLENIARELRGVNSVWGGIQLVVTGDFFQLPPILKNDGSSPIGKEFAFEADCWGSSFGLHVELEKVYRQSDPKLIEMLQSIRRGERDPAGLKLLKQSCSKTDPDSSVVELYPRNSDVLRVNSERLKSLNQKPLIFTAVEKGSQQWLKQLRLGTVPDEITLCEGARVMLVKNQDTQRKLVNGATGTIVKFSDELFPAVRFDFGATIVIEPETWTAEEGKKVVARRTQIPLILAWSVSVHKCQGMTLDRLRTDLSRAFGYGMVYVALSRVRSLDGLHLSGFSPHTIRAHPKVVQFYKDLAAGKCHVTGNGRSLD